ncbi:MAG: hypothetical protein DME32_04825 [Verrucomicrobia bacterium]|nr:MAG: hypothetical protein DME32_04825 [Verrucomicrobiota bacterium]
MLTARNASSGETASSGAVVEVPKNMKIILLAGKRKEGAVVIKTAFFRGKMTKHCAENSRCCV